MADSHNIHCRTDLELALAPSQAASVSSFVAVAVLEEQSEQCPQRSALGTPFWVFRAADAAPVHPQFAPVAMCVKTAAWVDQYLTVLDPVFDPLAMRAMASKTRASKLLPQSGSFARCW